MVIVKILAVLVLVALLYWSLLGIYKDMNKGGEVKDESDKKQEKE